MKKLMIALAAAATTVFAFGAGTAEGSNRTTFDETFGKWTGTSFEALTEGSVNVGDIVGKDDTGNQDGANKFWYSAATETDELGTITNEVAGAGVSRPDAFAKQNQTNTKSLQIDTTSPLFRTALPNSSGVQPVDIGDGIYLDTLVKFTAADEVFGTNALEAVDKIAIEYVERDADETAGITALTNFVVRAGFIGSELFVTNYAVALPDGWIENNKKDDWHRLTVRALLNIDGQNRVGFKIYLDENVLKYVTDNDEFAQSSGIDDATHTIFPSAVETDKNNYSDISSVAFSGSGFIDDVVFTTEKPDFIKNSEAVVVPFVADAGVTAISVKVGDNEVTNIAVTAAGTYAATLEAQTANFTVDVTVDKANGYTFGSITVGETAYDTNPASVTGYTGGEITITTIRNNFNLFDENGDPIQGTFQTLTEAFAAEGVAMIKLAYDYDALAFEGEDFDGYDIDGEIVLDLNGNDLDGGDDSAGVSLFRVTDTLTIKDSVGGGSITYDTQYGYAIVKNDGSDVFIGAATGDAGATFNGKLFEDGYEGNIVKGYIDDANNADEGEFLWDSYVDGGSAYELVDDYWVVTPKGGSEDWPENPSTVSGQTAQAAFGITGDLANADAATLATWAKANSVNYADRTTAILTDAFLLNCANTQAAIDEAAANFKITAITVSGDTVTIAPADGADYGNGKVVIEGTATLSPISWHEKTDGDHFFRATLVVKPVAVP